MDGGFFRDTLKTVRGSQLRVISELSDAVSAEVRSGYVDYGYVHDVCSGLQRLRLAKWWETTRYDAIYK